MSETDDVPRMSRAEALRRLAPSAVALLLIAVLVFLWASRFFDAWDGRVVAARPVGGDAAEADAYQVLVVEDDDDTRVLVWPERLVAPFDLPLVQALVPPADIPDDAPVTRKARFQLYFLVQQADGTHAIEYTLSPSALMFGLLAAVLGLLARNAYVSGSPFDVVPRARRPLRRLQRPGTVETPTATSAPRPTIGPPPPKGAGGRRRRRR